MMFRALKECIFLHKTVYLSVNLDIIDLSNENNSGVIMTKQEAIEAFMDMVGPFEFNGDEVAEREAWNNFTDTLRKDGDITEKQYQTWSNPF